LKQISDRAQMKQQQQQKDHVLHQKSLYGAPFVLAQQTLQAPAVPAAARSVNLGVRSFLDPGNRELLLFVLRHCVLFCSQ
jgi:hypothetical protein